MIFGVQLVAFSAGALAYRVIAGPYLMFAFAPDGFRPSSGVDARYLLIIGESNRVPEGFALNVFALAGSGPGSYAGPRSYDTWRGGCAFSRSVSARTSCETAH